MSTFTSSEFRKALGNYATGVAIISARVADGDPVGITANSFASVSLDPPLVLWSVDKSSSQCDVFVNCEYFAVHILQEDQQQLARTFSDDDADKFNGLIIERGVADLPLISECSVVLQCKVANVYEEGDHFILVGKVVDMRAGSVEPLVFFSGTYTRLQS